ncbi:hypothetical protein [Bradyrhizobium sp. SZCCHNR2032]|uniref:hypothetical protein n=1 Tax=Bradyrhizobium sp. SZCCHNR2032 TaxID=3057384 RepID=UPI002916C774|nr:hypothetical protein [Bradyrhizobium sp. SZCCHNR2032]
MGLTRSREEKLNVASRACSGRRMRNGVACWEALARFAIDLQLSEAICELQIQIAVPTALVGP